MQEKPGILPIGLLMIEHRLIERMLRLMEKEQHRFLSDHACDIRLIKVAVDFFMNYTDKCHYAKEEEILFKQLALKNLLTQHRQILKELIQEHKSGRVLIERLKDAAENFQSSQNEATNTTKVILGEFIALYKHHIEK